MAEAMMTPEYIRELDSYIGFLTDHDLYAAFESEPINRSLAENKSPFGLRPVTTGRQSATPRPIQTSVLPVADLASARLEARQRASAARSLDELYAELEAFKAMPARSEGAKTLVKYRGTATPHLIVIGEAPEAEDDQSGEAFSGPGGRLMRKAIEASGLKDAVMMTPCLFWRPAGGRPLNAEDIDLGAPFLHALIRLTAPKALLLLGSAAVSLTLNIEGGLGKLRGRTLSFGGDGTAGGVPATATLPPSFLLQNPEAKGLVWADLLNLVADLRQS